MIRQLVSQTSTLLTVLALIRSPVPSQPFAIITHRCFVSFSKHQQQGNVNILLKKGRVVCSSSPSSSAESFSSTSTSLNMSSSSSSSNKKKRVLVPIADGSEEIETTCITDTLVRFGADVTIASVKPDGNLLCTMSRGIQIQADTTIAKCTNQEWDLIALPGGMPGAEHLRDCSELITLLQKQQQGKEEEKEGKKKFYGAMCAAPAVVLATHNLIPTTGKATCYPAPIFRDKIAAIESNDKVVLNDNLTTSQGPGTALLFALQLGENLFGIEKRNEIAKAMLVD